MITTCGLSHRQREANTIYKAGTFRLKIYLIILILNIIIIKGSR